MKPDWEDVNARARGLGTHLLSRAALDRLEGDRDLERLAGSLRDAGLDIPEDATRASDLERAVRRWAAAKLGVLRRWCGPRSAVLAVLLEEEDRRSLRALMRGAVQRASAEARLAGLMPTPALPESALAELAGQPTIRDLVNLLIAWRNPYAPALTPEAFSPQPDLLALELALARAFAARSLHEAERSGRHGPIVEHVRLMIDLDNAQTAIALSGGDAGAQAAEFFLPGGKRIAKHRFLEAVHAGSAPAAAERLAAGFDGTPLAAALRDAVAEPARLESGLLAAEIGMLDDARRLDPLGPVTFLHFMLRLRHQLVELRRIIWTVALGGDARTAAAGAAS